MVARKKTKIDNFEEDLKSIDPKVIELIKKQVREELAKDDIQLKEELKKKLAVEKRLRTQYVNKMLKSDTPWFELVATAPIDDDSGLEYQMEWNTSFQRFLVSKKIMGVDDLERVEHWLIEMLHNIIEQKEKDKLEKGESEFE
jgi:hypothetical protein